jgi:hypothetical protein
MAAPSTTKSSHSSKKKSSSNNRSLLKKKHPLTNTNSDSECLRDDAGPLRRALYTIDTHNGFKFFNIYERTGCHAVAWLCFATVATYSVVFFKGFLDGVSSTAEAVAAD